MDLQELKAGQILLFANEDQTLEAEVLYISDPKTNWANGYKILFNGAIVHSSKTIKPLKIKIIRLCENYGLSRVQEI